MLVRIEERPVYYMGEFPNDFGASNYGLYLKVNKKLSANENVAIINPLIRNYFHKLINSREPVDFWGAMHYRLMTGRLCRISAILYQLGDHQQEDTGGLNDKCQNYYGILGYIGALLNLEVQDKKYIEELLNSVITMRDQSISKSDSSKPEYYRGELLLLHGDVEGAKKYFRSAIQRWPHPENPAIKRLNEISSKNYMQ
ncbi:MAG: hypothetical protein R3321_13390, partial [Nitrososphaeraceae archaeon]|nr:hypothetical protein [Nitrososphaeraceae archaeon]